MKPAAHQNNYSGPSQGQLTKCVLQAPLNKADSGSKPQFEVFVDPQELQKWKTDKTVALSSVVDKFEVFYHDQSQQGELRRPSKAELEDAFGTSKVEDVIVQVLEKGSVVHSSKHV